MSKDLLKYEDEYLKSCNFVSQFEIRLETCKALKASDDLIDDYRKLLEEATVLKQSAYDNYHKALALFTA